MDAKGKVGILFLALEAVLIAGVAEGASELLGLRREYNAASAEIDSLVRAMEAVDPEALDVAKLPEGDGEPTIPDGMEAVLIFWADDEARVWVNDYPVGETRLRPVEVTVPALYFGVRNRIRARCWDTDWVESGFLCGLYLKDGAGSLHPILVSDGTWETGGGKAQEITYAHPVPDVPGAETIWGTRIFGTVELTQTFDRQAIRHAASKAALAGRSPPEARKRRMEYHDFVQRLTLLEERREELKRVLLEQGGPHLRAPVYSGPERRSLSLTLGKAGPLQERVSTVVAERVQSWAQELPEAQKRLVYPERRGLKGEAAANPAFQQEAPVGGRGGERQRRYRPPEERGSTPPGTVRGEVRGGGTETGLGTAATGGGGRTVRAARLGLWVPTLILALYVGYVMFRWQDLTGGETRYPWGD